MEPSYDPDMDSILRNRLFRLSFEAQYGEFDRREHMVLVPVHTRGYHTKLKSGMVHPNRNSLAFANALLDAVELRLVPEGEREAAERSLMRVMALQDKDPASRTYGIWSYFLEEPLSAMDAPDWNWADFCGKELEQAWLFHGSKLAGKTKDAIAETLHHATESIKRRDMGPHYTNIAIMGTYVTLVYGEAFGVQAMKDYGKARLQHFLEHTRAMGSLSEYNSPNYNLLAATDMQRLLRDVHDRDCFRMAREIHDAIWKSISLHYDAGTGEWAGPHSRNYDPFLTRSTRTSIHMATGDAMGAMNEADLEMSTDLLHVELECPKAYILRFSSSRAGSPARMIRDRYQADDPDHAAATCIAPAFSLGTFLKSDLWNQRRPLIAFWGGTTHTVSLYPQFLHDGYDFSSALCAHVQKDGSVLGAIYFCWDQGDTHLSLDPIHDRTILAGDLRVRFRIVARDPEDLDRLEIRREGTAWTVSFGGVHVRLTPVCVEAPEFCPEWEPAQGADYRGMDLVFYRGPRKAVDLSSLRRFLAAFALEMTTGSPAKNPAVSSRWEGDLLSMEWPERGLSISIPAKPGPKKDLYAATKGCVR